MNIKWGVILLASILIDFSCKPQPQSTDEVIKRFFNDIKFGDYEKAAMLRCKVFATDIEIERYHFKRLHDLLVEHGIPPKDKWTISYDTTGEIVKMKKYEIELYKEFDKNKNRDGSEVIDLIFDYTRMHVGDSIMFFNIHPLWKDNK